jgi:hypothetical protein
MEAVFESEKFCADAPALGAQVSGVGASEFQRCFHGFGAAVAKEYAVEAADLGEAEGELGGVLVEEEVRGVDEALALTIDRFLDGRVSVAKGGDADAAEEIEEVLTFFVAEIDALSADKQVRIALVGLKKQLTLRCLDRC